MNKSFGIKLFGSLLELNRKVFVLIDNALKNRELPYYCPCCNTRLFGWRHGRFIKHPEIYNSDRYKDIKYNTLCPICNSMQRHRIIVLYLKDFQERLRNQRILYFAVEKCVGDWLKKSEISYTSADLYIQADLKIDIQDTGLPDSSYDLIICNHVLEHVEDYRKALRELYRILSNKGILICSFPMDLKLDTVYEDGAIVGREDRLQHFGQFDHLRVFGKDSREILSKAGFIVSTIDEEIVVSDKILPLPGPADYDQPIVFVCRKGVGVGDE